MCLPVTLQAMHPRPVRIAPVPPARTRYVSHPPEHYAKEAPKALRKNHLPAIRQVSAKASHDPRRQKHALKVKAVVSTGRDRPPTARALPAASKAPTKEPLTPIVSIIRQAATHPQLEPIEEVATTPQILPSIYGSDGRLAMPPALRGSHDILLHQNQMADQDGLNRVQDDEDLLQLRNSKALVPLPQSEGMRIDDRLPLNRRFCRPWVALFLLNLGRAHYDRFHTPLQINSAVRTVAVQVKLLRTNGNAAQADGEAASPHLTGQAVDIAKRGLPQAEIAWMRLYLQSLIDQGAIDVEEEFQQACFHLSVYRRYAPPAPPEQKIASTHRPLAPAIAAAIE